jgi:chromosomal replication initiation ATPase DnaA
MYRSTLETHLNEFVTQNYNRSEVEEVVRMAMKDAVRQLPTFLFDPEKKDRGNKEPLWLVLGIISRVTNVPANDIRSAKRYREIVVARHLYYYFASMYYGKEFSLRQIGSLTHDADHTTVIHGREKIKELLSTKDKYVHPYYEEILTEITQIN